MKRLLALMAVVFLAAPVSAQDAPKVPTAQVAGNWDVSFTSPQGAATWRVKLEQAGDTLRGSVAAGEFGNLDVTNGWITGNDLSFTLNMNFNGTPIQLNFAGTVKSDTIQGNIDVPNVGIQPFPFTGVKVAAFGSLSTASPVVRPRLVRLALR